QMAEPKRVPVTVLTGFLGSGKTTLLNHILQTKHGMKFAIIENEFGEVGVDEKVIKEDSEEQVIEVMNGCICCTVRGDLVKVLKKLRSKLDTFDGVIIETTGMADPAPVAQTFFVDPEVQKIYHLDGIVTVVDCKHVLAHLKEEKPEGVENETVEQIAFADRIILNKTDLVDDAALEEVVTEVQKVNKDAELIKAQHSKVDPAKLLGINAFSLDRVLEMDPEFMNTDGEHQHDNSISSISWKFEGELNVNKMEMWISEMLQTKAADMFRYKGMLAVKGMDTKYLFQGVHMLFNGGFSEDYTWKEGETRECRFVFIGRNLDKALLEQKFMECKVTSEARFKAGDRVEANVPGGWKKAKIMRVWDEGNPYRIQLDDGTQVWAPDDSDNFVRALPQNGGLCGAVAVGRQRRRLRALPFGISVVGTGSAAPETVVSNDDLAEIVETSDEWISQRTGIRRRHVLAPDESLASLSTKAASRALEAAKMSPEDVDLVIHATSTPDDLFGTGPQVASMLGADNAVAFDLTAACSGFVFALTTAAQYVRSGSFKSAVVIGADCLSRWVDWSDRNTCVLFGDGAGAMVITATDAEKDALLGFRMGSDGNGACHLGLNAEADGVSLGAGKEGGNGRYRKVTMNGKEVFRFATSRAPETLSKLMEEHNISGEEVDWLLLHQANRRIMDSAARRLKLPKEKILCNLDEYGNTSAASIPLALDEAVKEGKVQPGQLVACCGFGAGLTWGGGRLLVPLRSHSEMGQSSFLQEADPQSELHLGT
ncbi:fabH, partial [Symbiodinium sp. CCMP2456]